MAILHDNSSAAQNTRSLFRQLLDLGKNEVSLEDALCATLVVMEVDGSADGCHNHLTTVTDYIFLNRGLWVQWDDAITKGTSAASSLLIVVVATLLHELAHRCVSLAIGATDRPLAFVDKAVVQFGFTTEQAQKLKDRFDLEVSSKLTPEKVRVDWIPNAASGRRGEAGFFVEYNVFGGILEWDRTHQQVRLHTSVSNHSTLSQATVTLGARKLLVNYADECGLPDTISPSPSSSTLKKATDFLNTNQNSDVKVLPGTTITFTEGDALLRMANE